MIEREISFVSRSSKLGKHEMSLFLVTRLSTLPTSHYQIQLLHSDPQNCSPINGFREKSLCKVALFKHFCVCLLLFLVFVNEARNKSFPARKIINGLALTNSLVGKTCRKQFFMKIEKFDYFKDVTYCKPAQTPQNPFEEMVFDRNQNNLRTGNRLSVKI